MSNFTDFIGGSGGGSGRKYVDLIILDRSTTWSPRQDCKAVVTVIGGGGSGGCTAGTYIGASGGGAGGLAQSDIIDLSATTTYTATVGAGGLPRFINQASNTLAGNNGGNSSFSGSGITTLTANGGGAGQYGSAPTNGGTGGGASGGLYNYTGGAGGNCYGYASGGGGAVNITGTAYAGGNYTHSNQATGGAGTGGSPYSTGAQYQAIREGGKAAIYSVIDFDYMIIDYKGRLGVNTNQAYIGNEGSSPLSGFLSTPEKGVGGNGLSGTHLYACLKAQNGGMFAGGGAYVFFDNTAGFADSYTAGHGGIFGGGGGGASSRSSSVKFAMSGAGGDGVVFIAVTEYL